MTELGSRTEKLIVRRLAPDVAARVSELLFSRCTAERLGCTGWTTEQMERIWFAVLRVGGTSCTTVEAAVVQAETDWRDLLVAAGFEDDVEAHLMWWEDECKWLFTS